MKYYLPIMLVFVATVITVILGIPSYNAFMLGVFICYGFGLAQGHSLRELTSMALNGAKRGLIVVFVMLLIGGLIGVWLANGTVASMMYYGLKYLSNFNFLFVSYGITLIVSMAIGTNIGTASTVGIALVGIGTSIGIPLPIIAGAVISGSSFGDRTSPMGGTLNLLSGITGTKVTDNFRLVIKNAYLPLVLAGILYLVIGSFYSSPKDLSILDTLSQNFSIGVIPILSVIGIIMLITFKVNLKTSMALGILVGIITGVFYSGIPFNSMIDYCLRGFVMEGSAVSSILKGGGVLSMRNLVLMVFFATSFTGLLEELKIMEVVIGGFVRSGSDRFGLGARALVLSIISSMIGCNQTLGIILPGRFMARRFIEINQNRDDLVLGISDGGVMMAPIIPWNVNAMAMAAPLSVSVLAYIPYAFLCYLFPLTNLLYLKLRSRQLLHKSK